MKNFIMIENDNLIEIEDLKYIGSSTKRDDHTKIGQFGSGWKFALAWILRNQLDIRIFSGTNEIKVDFDVKLHRNNPIKVLTVNGVETSITSGMGEIDWTGWMALREIVSNAMDEGGENVKTYFNPDKYGVPDKTRIYVEMNGELAEVLQNFNKYFRFDGKTYYEHEGFKVYKKAEPSTTLVFRKGIRCYQIHDSLFDYNFDNITINESRISDYHSFSQAFNKSFRDITDSSVFLEILENTELSLFSDNLGGNLEANMKTLSDKGYTFRPKSIEKVFGIFIPGITIPSVWYSKLVEKGIIEDVLKQHMKGSSNNGEFYILDELRSESDRITFELSAIFRSIKVVFVKFIKGNSIMMKDGTIYISDSYIEEATSDLFARIMYSLSTNDLKEIYFKSK